VARIFLCHANEDKAQVREVYHRLQAIDGLEPWLDEEDLLPGQDWTREIPRALQTSDFILIFFSRLSVAKRGYVQREMKLALDALQELPEGTIHTIPVRLDDCELPQSFQHYHYANLFDPHGFDRIVRAIRAESAKRSGPTPPPSPQPSPGPIDAAPQQGKTATPPIREQNRPEVHRHTTSDAREITGLSPRQKRRLVLVGGVLLCVLVTALYLVLSGRTLGPQLPSSLTNSLGMQFALIPAGEFQMGSTIGDEDERPVHTVRVSKPFYLGIHEVTQGQWETIMGSNPSTFKGDANRPVETISWEEVQKFIAKLSTREGSTKYRLPTEAEWEYAARAGSTTTYSFGDDSSQLGQHAWFRGNAGNTTHPVGTLQPNAWGLYDMHGNVWEWVRDWYGKYPAEPVTDPPGPASGSGRVIRGGGWGGDARDCRSAYRYSNAPGYSVGYLGFRLLRTAP
jgi:formylglycine-generating enzyme required for sulfatase activity